MSAVSHAYLQHATRLAERGVVFVTVTLVMRDALEEAPAALLASALSPTA